MKRAITKKQCEIEIDGENKGFYGYPTSEEIYESIEIKKEIYFPRCLIPEIIIHSKKDNNNIKKIELNIICLSGSIFTGHNGYQFSDIKINGIINFSNAKFYNVRCFFTDCNFEVKYKGNSKISFTRIECYGSYLQFNNVNIIDSQLNFMCSSLKESTIEFYKTNIQLIITNKVNKLLLRLYFYGLSLDNRSKIKIESSRIETILDLRLYEWLGEVILRDVDIKKCEHIDFWTNSIKGVFDAYGFSKEIIDRIVDSSINGQNEDASILLMLKRSYNQLGYYEDEDNCYVAYRRQKAIDNFNKNKGYKKIMGFVSFISEKFIFDFIGGYGTKPKSVFRFMILVILGFAPMYAFIPDFLKWDSITKHFCNIPFFNKLLIGLYHSMITFLTIGYGDIAPKSVYGSLLSGIEGFLGLFLMSYFTIAFSRKVLR